MRLWDPALPPGVSSHFNFHCALLGPGGPLPVWPAASGLEPAVRACVGDVQLLGFLCLTWHRACGSLRDSPLTPAPASRLADKVLQAGDNRGSGRLGLGGLLPQRRDGTGCRRASSSSQRQKDTRQSRSAPPSTAYRHGVREKHTLRSKHRHVGARETTRE